MANVLAPFGLTPVRRLDGASWTGNQTPRLIANANTNAIFQGDLVKSLTTGYIDRAAAGDTPVAGIFVGCSYYNTSVSRRVYLNYWPGSGATGDVDCYIIDDPFCVFLAQCGTGSTTPAGIDNIGNVVKITAATAGNTTTGISGHAIDLSTAQNSANSTWPLRIIAVPGQVGTTSVPLQSANPLNATVGAAANGYDALTKFNVVLVAFNSQDFKVLTGI